MMSKLKFYIKYISAGQEEHFLEVKLIIFCVLNLTLIFQCQHLINYILQHYIKDYINNKTMHT